MTEEKDKKKYDLGISEKKDSINKKVDQVLDTKKLDESNPLERAKKFAEVKKNPPKPDYMKVKVYGGEEKGEPVVYSKSKDENDKEKILKHDPFFTIDLNTLIMSDIAACPSNVVPMLIDQAVTLAINEGKAFKPDKQKEPFNWWWLVMGLLMIPSVILVILLVIGA